MARIRYVRKLACLLLCAWIVVGCSQSEQPALPDQPPAEQPTMATAAPEANNAPTNTPAPAAPTVAPSTAPKAGEEALDLTRLWSYGLTSKRTGEALITEDGMHNLDPALVSYGYNLVVDRDGNTLTPVGTPLQGGEQLAATATYQEDSNMREYVRIFTIMAPIRDAILYGFESTSRDEWLALTQILTSNNIKTTDAATVDARSILSNAQVYDYIAGGPTDGSPVMRYLEEAGLELKCLAFVDFDFTNPEGKNHCEEQNIAVGSGIKTP